MPGADDKKTKYTKEGAYELVQWASKGNKVSDGSVTTERKMTGGTTGAKAEASKSGDTYTVTFTRKNPGEGKACPSASLFMPTTRAVASITSHLATNWASAPTATSRQPSSKSSLRPEMSIAGQCLKRVPAFLALVSFYVPGVLAGDGIPRRDAHLPSRRSK
jgi:hypothetical protein